MRLFAFIRAWIASVWSRALSTHKDTTMLKTDFAAVADRIAALASRATTAEAALAAANARADAAEAAIAPLQDSVAMASADDVDAVAALNAALDAAEPHAAAEAPPAPE